MIKAQAFNSLELTSLKATILGLLSIFEAILGIISFVASFLNHKELLQNKNDILDSIAVLVYLEVVNEIRKVLADHSIATSWKKIRLFFMGFFQKISKYPEKFRAVM